MREIIIIVCLCLFVGFCSVAIGILIGRAFEVNTGQKIEQERCEISFKTQELGNIPANCFKFLNNN